MYLIYLHVPLISSLFSFVFFVLNNQNTICFTATVPIRQNFYARYQTLPYFILIISINLLGRFPSTTICTYTQLYVFVHAPKHLYMDLIHL